MKMPQRRIREVVLPIRNWNPQADAKTQDFDYIDIASIAQGSKSIAQMQSIPCASAPSRARQLVQQGDVIVSTVRPNLNAVALVTQGHAGATASTGFCVLRPDLKQLCPEYLYHWVRTPRFVSEMARLASGQSYPAVSDRIILDSQVPLPPLPEQKRIAAILDKADAVRRKRAEAIKLTDQFLKAAFLDMFGDPVTNSKGWPSKQLGDVALIASGVTKGRDFNGKDTVHAPYMRVASVQDGYLDLSNITDIEILPTDIAKYRLEEGDILLTEGGDPDKLGRGAVWRGEIPNCVHQNHIFRVRPDSTCALSEFLCAQIGSARGKRYFMKAAKQTTGIASINMTQLRAFPALLPPIELQFKFEQLTSNFKAKARKWTFHCTHTNNLFRSLTQRAFRGEL